MKKLFNHYKFYITENTKPSPSDFNTIIECAGGKVITRKPSSKNIDSIYVISCEQDKDIYRSLIEEGGKIYSKELVLLSILRQEINLDEYLHFLKIKN